MISSDPSEVCFCHESQHYNYDQTCIANTDPLTMYPGEKITVSVITVGQRNGSTSGIINASLLNENENHTLVNLNNTGHGLSAVCVNLTFAIKSNRETAYINFKPIISEFSSIYGNIFPNLTVYLRPCPLGFQLSNQPPYECVCNPILSEYLLTKSLVKCNINNQIISIQQRGMWFGCLLSESHNQTAACDSLVVAPNCDYYCRSATNDSNKIINISVVNPDSQCSPGHTGIMCGACKSGYSRILGGALECIKGCTSHNFPIIILSFLLLNIVLIIFIMSLNLTVTQGTLNGLLVYTMVIQTHRTYFPDDAFRLWTSLLDIYHINKFIIRK